MTELFFSWYFLLVVGLPIVTWGNMFVIPAVLASKRRKQGKPIFWPLLLLSVVMEISISVVMIQVGMWMRIHVIAVDVLAFIVSPLMGAFLGGYYYWTKAKAKDRQQKI